MSLGATTDDEAPAGVARRAVRPEDEPFLLRLYASTREEELARVPWTDEQKAAFVVMQFQAQAAHYAYHYAEAERSVLVVDGIPAGRLYVLRSEREIRIVDVSLLPEFRGRGIGTALLSDLADECDREGLDLTIHVERDNRAMSLYRRMGFVMAEERGAHFFMSRPPRRAEDRS